MSAKKLKILGIRGIPAAHGGFETFAERLALYLVSKGWQVSVYCQQERTGEIHEDDWRGVRRVHIPVALPSGPGSVVFDWRSTLHAARESGLVLTLGYNTAIFNAVYRFRSQPNVVNMDGLEWKRQKWGLLAKSWFWLNDWLGCLLGNHLIADHPEIRRHLLTRVGQEKISTIAYGADLVEHAEPEALAPYGLTPGGYAILIARPERENSILEVVRAWSSQKRGKKLVVLGNYEAKHAYHCAVKAAASDEVIFLGAIYDQSLVQALRFFARFYVHGHQVGGTNPSLVESLAAGNAVLAHDNVFNRQVASEGGLYFGDQAQCEEQIRLLLDDDALLQRLKSASQIQHRERFTWAQVLADYEAVLAVWAGGLPALRSSALTQDSEETGNTVV